MRVLATREAIAIEVTESEAIAYGKSALAQVANNPQARKLVPEARLALSVLAYRFRAETWFKRFGATRDPRFLLAGLWCMVRAEKGEVRARKALDAAMLHD